MVRAADLSFRELLDELDPRCRQRLAMEFRAAARRANKPKLRTRVQFALEEIVCPEGPHKGELLLEEFQPFAIDLLRQMDATPLRRFAITGCVQSGKTLIVIVVNLLYHLFELGHTVIYGVPEMKMAKKKWEKEILPVIMANPRFRQLLPDTGSGSKGGFDGTIAFKNGATLEFMGATGNDSRRTSSTAQVLVMTEVDRYDVASDGSREGAPVVTMEDRVAAYEDNAYIYKECTRTITTGHINQQVLAGTQFRLYAPCPHCKTFVHPGRKDLVGFEDCENVVEARRHGTFVCPNEECRCIITEDQRKVMQAMAVSVARTQTVRMGSDGSALIEGELPATDIFSYEWDAFFNRFWETAYLAEQEWKGMVGRETEDGEKQAKQKRWAIAVDPTDIDIDPLTSQGIYERHCLLGRGMVPVDAICLTAGIDIRKSQLHWVIIAWRANGSGHIVDYGIWDVPWRELGVEEAIPTGMVELWRKVFAPGILVNVSDGQLARRLPVGYKLYDLGYMTDSVREGLRRLAKEGARRARGIFGRGQSEPPGSGSYVHPKAISEAKPWVGRDCYMAYRKETRELEVVANSDEWKSFLRRAISPDTPAGVPGALTVWEPKSTDEKKLARDFGKQILAETQKRRQVPRRGEVDVWEHENGVPNHWGDGAYYASVGSQLEGIKIAKVGGGAVPLSQQIAVNPVVGAAN